MINLKHLRKKSGLTQKALAEIIGVTSKTVHNRETGRTKNLRLYHSSILVETLECNLKDLKEMEELK